MSDRDDDRHAPDLDDPDAPATAEEVAASERLRDALDGALAGLGVIPDAAAAPEDATGSPELELALSLRAAWQPGSLSADESHAVLDAVPSAEEQELAAVLREALDARREPRLTDPRDVQLAHALRSAFAPAAIDGAEHTAMIETALAKMPATAAREAARVVPMRRGVVVRVAFGAFAGGLAVAASIVFVVTSAPLHSSEAPLAKTRTTQPLFSEPFKPGEASARIDRIASARASDFRDNRFTKWGVR